MSASFKSHSRVVVVDAAGPASSASQVHFLKEKIGARGMRVDDVLAVAICSLSAYIVPV